MARGPFSQKATKIRPHFSSSDLLEVTAEDGSIILVDKSDLKDRPIGISFQKVPIHSSSRSPRVVYISPEQCAEVLKSGQWG